MERCLLCKSADPRQVEESHGVTVPRRAGPLRVVVSGVPAVVCGACGEGFFANFGKPHGPPQRGAAIS